MTFSHKWLLFAVAGVIGLFTPGFCHAYESNSWQVQAVELTVQQLPVLLQRNPTAFSFFSFDGKHFHEIPWQWDSTNEEGDLTFKEAAKPSFQEKDVISWMASDMGERASPAQVEAQIKAWKKESKGESMPSGYELEVSITGTTSKWVYLVRDLASSWPSQLDYVTYDPKSDFIQTPYFFMSYGDVIHVNSFGWVLPSGERGPNLLNGVSPRFNARAFFGLIPLDVTEKDLENTMIGYKDGPIRIIKRLSSSARLPLGFKGPSNQTDQFFYRNYYKSAIAIEMPVGSKALLTKARFKIYVDMMPLKNLQIDIPSGENFRIYPALTKGVHSVSQDPPSWMYFGEPSEPQAFVVGVLIDEEAKKVLQPRNLIYDHGAKATTPDGKPTETNTMGTLSFEVGIASKSGSHPFSLYLFALGNLCHGESPQAVMKALEAQVKSPPKLKAIMPIGVMAEAKK